MAERKVIGQEGHLAVYEIEVKDRDKTVKTSFKAPRDGAGFKAWVGSLTGEDLDKTYGLHMYAADLKARAAAREAVVAESTVIKRDGKDIDLMALPTVKACAAVNAAYGLMATVGGEAPKAFQVTRRKLLESGKVHEQNGLLVVK